ncbi:NAD-dependent epimerase/dehydratase family protein [Spirosoma taeanense]|uniref:NAD-dependent epimerase/dehydratase family protein n=1 Tax=Spirosoma taeanense TaxID=2735870 RepID=A0A6M5YBW1_9BACT|nr:NAD-dependent epimerase/dehydratase family protein [Spirosoma taeanense]QJW90770.1 NAD-dependent epimerase/dehydratase family protein [Spirosoma taeanense]
MNVILTGATGMVGEGVLLQCLANPTVKQVLSVSRKSCGRKHPKLKELLVDDFLQLSADNPNLKGYDACFYCAGISSNGMSEQEYTHITYDTTLHFAQVVLQLNPQITFNFVSGAGTNSSEKGGMMWARVKGRTENALQRMGFKAVFCFRPGLLKPDPEQRYVTGTNKFMATIYPVLSLLVPHCTTREVGLAMIHVAEYGFPKTILSSKDIRKAAEKGN